MKVLRMRHIQCHDAKLSIDVLASNRASTRTRDHFEVRGTRMTRMAEVKGQVEGTQIPLLHPKVPAVFTTKDFGPVIFIGL